jgi:hypothetical protein
MPKNVCKALSADAWRCSAVSLCLGGSAAHSMFTVSGEGGTKNSPEGMQPDTKWYCFLHTVFQTSGLSTSAKLGSYKTLNVQASMLDPHA